MNKTDFINSLDGALQALDSEERKDILADYETHFSEGMAEGKSEQDIIRELGDIEHIAARFIQAQEASDVHINNDMVNTEDSDKTNEVINQNQVPQESVEYMDTDYSTEYVEDSADNKDQEPVFVPYEKQPRSGLAQAFIIIGLILFNATFILGPFVAIWSIWFSLIVSGGAFTFESIRIIIFSSMGTYNAAGLSDITMFAQIGFYLTFGLFLILVSLKFGSFLGQMTKKYLNWNSRIVKGV